MAPTMGRRNDANDANAATALTPLTALTTLTAASPSIEVLRPGAHASAISPPSTSTSFSVRARRNLRPARSQRGRQDDHLPHALRPAARQRRAWPRVAGMDLRTARAQARSAYRLCLAGLRAVRKPVRGRENLAFLRRRLRTARHTAARTHRRRARDQFALQRARSAQPAANWPAASSSAWPWR